MGKAVLKTKRLALVLPKGVLLLIVMFLVMTSQSSETSHPPGTAEQVRTGPWVTFQEGGGEGSPQSRAVTPLGLREEGQQPRLGKGSKCTYTPFRTLGMLVSGYSYS